MNKDQVNAYLLDENRSAEELIGFVGVIKDRLDALSAQGQTAREFADATLEYEQRAKAKFGIPT